MNKYHILFCNLSDYGCIGCFQDLAIINCAATNTGMHESMEHDALSCLEKLPRKGDSWIKWNF